MARERMVTRTIFKTVLNVMCVDTETAEVQNKDVVIGGTFKCEKDLLKTVKKLYETETLKIVSIVDTREEEQLLGMSENDFIKYAHPVTRGTETETQEK